MIEPVGKQFVYDQERIETRELSLLMSRGTVDRSRHTDLILERKVRFAPALCLFVCILLAT